MGCIKVTLRPVFQKAIYVMFTWIEIKFGMSNYQHPVIYTTKFEFDSFYSSGDKSSQTYRSYEAKESSSSDLPLEYGFNSAEISFYVENRSFRPNLAPL